MVVSKRGFELFDIRACLGKSCELSLNALEALENGGVIAVAEKLADLGEAVRSKTT